MESSTNLSWFSPDFPPLVTKIKLARTSSFWFWYKFCLNHSKHQDFQFHNFVSMARLIALLLAHNLKAQRLWTLIHYPFPLFPEIPGFQTGRVIRVGSNRVDSASRVGFFLLPPRDGLLLLCSSWLQKRRFLLLLLFFDFFRRSPTFLPSSASASDRPASSTSNSRLRQLMASSFSSACTVIAKVDS